MTGLVITLALAISILLVALVLRYLRRSTLQAFQDDRTALVGAQEGKSQAAATEGDALLGDLRKLLLGLLETIRDERATTTKLRDYVNKERDASQAFCEQSNAARLVVEGLCAQLTAERRASEVLRDQLDAQRITYEALCEELDAQRLALVETFYHLNAPARVEAAAQAIERLRAARKGKADVALVQGQLPDARQRDEETKREGVPAHLATLDRQRTASTEQARAREKQPAARAAEELSVGERPTALPTTANDVAVQRKLLAATAVSDLDADGTAMTQALSTADMEAALHAAENGEAAEDGEPTRAWSSAALTAALEAEAGGATLSPQSVPRVVHSGAVAPPASAPRPLPLTAPMKAAGLGGKTKSLHVAPPAPARRTATLAGMPAVHPHESAADPRTLRLPGSVEKPEGVGSVSPTPTGATAPAAVPFVAKTLISAQASSEALPFPLEAAEAPSEVERVRDTIESFPDLWPEDSNNGDAPIKACALEPPMYAARRPAPPNAEASRGFDGVPEAASAPGLAPTDETPRRPRGLSREAAK